MAAVDAENHTAFHLEAVQTIDVKENETLIDYYLKVILERKKGLQELSETILADAYFSKYNFVNPLVEAGFTIISRLRDDADLKYIFDGKQKPGRGRPRKHDGKIDFKDLAPSKLKNVSSRERERIF